MTMRRVSSTTTGAQKWMQELRSCSSFSALLFSKRLFVSSSSSFPPLESSSPLRPRRRIGAEESIIPIPLFPLEAMKKKKTKKKEMKKDFAFGFPFSFSSFSSSSSNNNNNKRSFVVTGYGLDRPGIYGQFSRAMLNIRADVESSRLARLGPDFTITALVSFFENNTPKRRRKRTNVKTHADHHKIRSSVLEEEEEEEEEGEATTSGAGECETKKRLQDALDTRIDSFTFDVREVPPETRQNEEQSRLRGYKKLIIRATNFPGITARITETLSACGLNIETLRMDTKSSPFSNNNNNNNINNNDLGVGVGGDEMYFCETTVRLIEGAFEEEKFTREMEKLEDELSCDVDVEDVSDMQ